MDENFTAHELELVNESSNIIVDQELAQLQDDTALAIKNLGEHLDTIKHLQQRHRRRQSVISRNFITKPTGGF